MWQILFCNFAAYKKINLGNAGRMTLYISPVCCERKNKDTWRHSHNKTVIYYLFFCCCHWLKTRIVWTAHYKGIVKIFSPRLSDHFHTVHLACTRYLLQMKEQKKREAHLPKKKRKMTDCTITKQFGSKPQREMPRACWQQASAEEAQKMQLQTGHPIICSYAADWVPAWKWEMFNSLDCFVLSIAV